MKKAKRWSVIGFYGGFAGNLLFWWSPLAPYVDFDLLGFSLYTSVFCGIVCASIGFYCGYLVHRESLSGRKFFGS